jgi:Domain of unknown function (DUF3387)
LSITLPFFFVSAVKKNNGPSDCLISGISRDWIAEIVGMNSGFFMEREQERHVRENMSEEELVIFDILTRPAPELSPEERGEIKKVARELLARLKQLLVISWWQKLTARSQLKLAIEDALDSGLPQTYSPDLYKQKCSALFEHFYENYPDKEQGPTRLEKSLGRGGCAAETAHCL